MRLSFRPMPVLSMITLVMLSILIWLGTWQYQRLQWKTDLLADVETAVSAPPYLSLIEVFNDLNSDRPVDFRRIQLHAEHVAFEIPKRVFTAENRDVSWRLFSPVTADGVIVFGGFEIIADGSEVQGKEPVKINIAGYVRRVRYDEKQHTQSSPDKNRWFGFNPMPDTHNWAHAVNGSTEMRIYLDVVEGVDDAADLPIKRPDIRNNHFDYMLTWYGLAIVLLIIYGVLHYKEGRLSWR